MKTKRCTLFSIILITVFLSACTCEKPVPEAPTAAAPAAYPVKPFVLGPGDGIDINIWRNDDLNRSIQIGPSGNIFLPLVGEVQAQGMTVAQLREELTRSYAAYLKSPKIDINISTIASLKVHVLGQVSSPGTIEINGPITLWEAISKSGGFTDDANREHLLIIRNENGAAHGRVVSLNLDTLFNKGVVNQISYLQPDDVIYVAERRIASFEKFMLRLQNLLGPILATESGIVLGKQVYDVFKGDSGSNDVIISP